MRIKDIFFMCLLTNIGESMWILQPWRLLLCLIRTATYGLISDARDIFKSSLWPAKRRGDLQGDDVDLAPHSD